MVSFVDESHSDSLVPWKRNHRLLTLSDNENVGETGSEVVVVAILDVDDLVRTWVMFNVHEGADTTNIVSTLDKDSGTVSEFDDFVDFASLEVQLNAKCIKYKFERKSAQKESARLTCTESFLLISGLG